MKLDVHGIDQVDDYLQDLAAQAPEAAHHGVEAGLELLADELRLQLGQAAGKVATRKNNLFTQFDVARRTVAVTFPGLNHVGWIAVTGLEAGGHQARKRYGSQPEADQHARAYAEALRRAENETEVTVTVRKVADGAEGELAAERQDDDTVQRVWDTSAEAAGQAAEDEIRKRVKIQ